MEAMEAASAMPTANQESEEQRRLQWRCLSWEAEPLFIILPIKTVEASTFLSKIRCPDIAGPDSLQLKTEI